MRRTLIPDYVAALLRHYCNGNTKIPREELTRIVRLVEKRPITAEAAE